MSKLLYLYYFIDSSLVSLCIYWSLWVTILCYSALILFSKRFIYYFAVLSVRSCSILDCLRLRSKLRYLLRYRESYSYSARMRSSFFLIINRFVDRSASSDVCVVVISLMVCLSAFISCLFCSSELLNEFTSYLWFRRIASYYPYDVLVFYNLSLSSATVFFSYISLCNSYSIFLMLLLSITSICFLYKATTRNYLCSEVLLLLTEEAAYEIEADSLLLLSL